MKVVVITCIESGIASLCLPKLAKASGVEVVGAILATSAGTSKSKARMRKFKKVLKIGLLGALNGVRMRKWYALEAEPLNKVCADCNIPFFVVHGLNSVEMQNLVKRLEPDLGLSLGNGFISPKVFEIPKLGMVNIHSEMLPQYQNAQSILWPIYCNDPYTGYTLHEITRGIDEGRILVQVSRRMRFFKRIEDTVRYNIRATMDAIPDAFADLCSNFENYRVKGREQGPGRKFTTPSIWQFLRMVVNNQRFYRQQEKGVLS